MTGAEAAEQMLFDNGIYDVDVLCGVNNFYNPAEEAIYLVPELFLDISNVGMATAAHEVGHAIQHQNGNVWLLLKLIFKFKWLTVKVEKDATDKALQWLAKNRTTWELRIAEKHLLSCLETYKK